VLVNVADDGTIQLTFTPLDVLRWVTAQVDVSAAADGYEVVDRIRDHLKRLLEDQGAMPLAARVRLVGETPAHDALFSDIERWTSEIRSAANDAGGGRIWIEKLQVDTRMPVDAGSMPQRDGAMGELLSLFEDLSADGALLASLFSELTDLARRLPPELKSGPEAIPLSDEAWMRELLTQVRPLLVKRLLGREPADAD
jgi:hypothetical protein